MTDVPGPVPSTVPDDEPTVATEVVPDVHVPPEPVPVSVLVLPAQITAVPEIAPGTAFTETTTDRLQPPGRK